MDITNKMRAAIGYYRGSDYAQSEQLCLEVLDAAPGHAGALFLLGIVYDQTGRKMQAAEQLRKAAACCPDRSDIHARLGDVLGSAGRDADAVDAYLQATALDPDNVAAWINLGAAYFNLLKFDKAVDCYNWALEITPENHAILYNLGNALKAQGRFDDAVDAYRTALSKQPDFLPALTNLASLYLEYGLVSESIEVNRRVLAQKPDEAVAASNILLALSYLPENTPGKIFSEHREYGHRYRHLAPHAGHRFRNDPSQDRCLRIGYVSPDFRNHPVASFIEPVIANHDRNNVKVYCYFNHFIRDHVTERLRGMADSWLDIQNMPDDEVARRILGDEVDILVDLAGHTARNRLPVFARKPAPVQATWLGYLNTTGLQTMDYRVTDAGASRPGDSDGWHTESLLRLPHSQWCYQQPHSSPEVGVPPVSTAGHFTFASFHNLAKITPSVIATWSETLNAVPGSRLLLVARGTQTRRSFLLEAFTANNVAADRIQIGEAVSFDDYLKLHRRVDINLDTYPYCGGTTTCHSLWMGVPVITLAGETATSRGGASILGAVGLDDLIATSRPEYVQIARRLASDTRALGELRSRMRGRMQSSPLMDAHRFCTDLESLYREMWHNWLRTGRCGSAP